MILSKEDNKRLEDLLMEVAKKSSSRSRTVHIVAAIFSLDSTEVITTYGAHPDSLSISIKALNEALIQLEYQRKLS